MKKLSIMMLIVMVAVAGLLASAAADEAATASPAPSAGVRPSYCSCLKGITQTACEDGLKVRITRHINVMIVQCCFTCMRMARGASCRSNCWLP
jgi:hypothetical protein